jgi:hypothetical protein
VTLGDRLDLSDRKIKLRRPYKLAGVASVKTSTTAAMHVLPPFVVLLSFAAPAQSVAGGSVGSEAPGFCAFSNIFGAGAPPQYVAYKLPQAPVQASQPPAITIDGSLDDAAWKEVAFTESNPDICGRRRGHCPGDAAPFQGKDYPCSAGAGGNCCSGGGQSPSACDVPRFTTRQKIRWDDEYLYIGAELEEPEVWANNTQHNSVIFQDNDYEVFISPDGSNHYYKEYEMNARGAWWDLCLNKPYNGAGKLVSCYWCCCRCG